MTFAIATLALLAVRAYALTCADGEVPARALPANLYCYDSHGGPAWEIRACLPAGTECEAQHTWAEDGASGQSIIFETSCLPNGYAPTDAWGDCPAAVCGSAEKPIVADSAEMACTGRASSCGYDQLFAGCVPVDQVCAPTTIFAEHVVPGGMTGTFVFEHDCIPEGFDILSDVAECNNLGCEFVNCPSSTPCRVIDDLAQCAPIEDEEAPEVPEDPEDPEDEGDDDQDDGSDNQNPPPPPPPATGPQTIPEPVAADDDDATAGDAGSKAEVIVSATAAVVFAVGGVAGYMHQRRGRTARNGYAQINEV